MITINQYYSEFKKDAIMISEDKEVNLRSEVWHKPGQTCRFTFESSESKPESLLSISKIYNE